MATARINIKSIDYFKFKKLVIDGNRDDYNSCSKEVKSLCDCVQTLNFRDEEFDDVADRGRFEEICSLYKQILTSKRIDSLDMRIKSGWWGDHKNAYSAGKIKPAALKDLLVSKAKNWISRHGDSLLKEKQVGEKIDGPGLYVFKHREHQCFQYVGMAERIFATCGEKLKSAFEGSSHEPLAALLIISMASDWDFYFIPVDPTDGDKVWHILENDLILKHDCIWPHGLNFRLSISSLLEVSEFRKSCLRHHWPPDADITEATIDLKKLREQILKAPESPASDDGPSPPSSVKSVETKSERPKSAKGQAKEAKPASKVPASSPTQPEQPKASPRPSSPRKLPSAPKQPPSSPARRPQSAKGSRPASAAARKTQKTPEPPEENGVSQQEEEYQSSPEEPKPAPRKASTNRPVASANKISPQEEKPQPPAPQPQPRRLPVKAAPPPPPEEPSPEEPEVEESQPPVPQEVSPEEDIPPPAAPLKRQGTYEILPTDEDQCEDLEAKNTEVPDDDGDDVATRPSRLPVVKS